MGLGATAKRLQTLAERAEQLYAQILELREQISELKETVETSGARLEELDRRSQQQWAVLQAVADAHDIDVDALLTEAAIEEVDVVESEEPPAEDAAAAGSDEDSASTD